MKIGVPKEIKNNESRVGMTPAGVFELIKNNHTVYVQQDAGFGSGFFDTDYAVVGAILVPTAAEVYAQADMIVKVKEPISEEYALIKENQIIFTYFHFASSEELTIAMINSKAVFKMERVFKPKKSIFNNPALSATELSNWVTYKSESLAVVTGT